MANFINVTDLSVIVAGAITSGQQVTIYDQSGNAGRASIQDVVSAANALIGGVSNIVSVSATYSALTTDGTINCTSGTFTVTLENTGSLLTGHIYTVKNSGSGVVTVQGKAGQTIDGSLTQSLNQYDSMTVQSDGTNWIII